MDTPVKYYHRPTHICLASGEVLPPEVLKSVRDDLAEDDKYNLKFVVFAVGHDTSGQMDMEWFLDALQKLGIWSLSGMTVQTMNDVLKERGFDKVQPVVPIRLVTKSAPLWQDDEQPVLANGHTNGHSNGHTNGRAVKPAKAAKRGVTPKVLQVVSASKPAIPAIAKTPQAKAPQPKINQGMTVDVKDPRRKQHGSIVAIEGDKAKVKWDSGTIRFISLDRLGNPRKYALK